MSFFVKFALLLVGLTGFGFSTAAQAKSYGQVNGKILYARPNSSGDCSFWTQACELGVALGKALPGDQIRVSEGVYFPTHSTDRSASFSLKKGVSIYGGLPLSGNWEARDWLAYPSILSGDIGVVGDLSDNSYHVVSGNRVDASALLDGFTITAGNANDVSPNDSGAGIYNYSSGPSLANLKIVGNIASQRGGGLYAYISDSHMQNITFIDNYAGTRGGGMFVSSSLYILSDAFFTGNSAGRSGGGLDNSYSNSRLANISFEGNYAAYGGGGLYLAENSSPSLTDITFTENSAGERGGGLFIYSGQPELLRTTFTHNDAGIMGGGIFTGDSAALIRQSGFFGNVAGIQGGGMDNNHSAPILEDVVFEGNTAGYGGGGIYNWDYSNPHLVILPVMAVGACTTTMPATQFFRMLSFTTTRLRSAVVDFLFIKAPQC